jgi:hypothetical protein
MHSTGPFPQRCFLLQLKYLMAWVKELGISDGVELPRGLQYEQLYE